jgi:hypothetical protein
MPVACGVCTHPSRGAIERDLMAGVPFSVIARTYGTGRDSLRNHKRRHVDREAWSKVPEPQRRVLTTLERVEQLAAILEADIARRLKRGENLLAVMAELRRMLELVAKLKRELDEAPHLNLLVAPDYLGVRAVIMAALEDHPDVRAEVAAALTRYESAAPTADPSIRDLRPALVKGEA